MLLERAGSAPASGCDGLDRAQHRGAQGCPLTVGLLRLSVWEKFVLSHKARAESS